MSKKAVVIVVLLVALVIAGCRVRDASEGDPREPTLQSNVVNVNVTNTPADDFVSPTAETLPDDTTPTETITPSPFVLPSNTPADVATDILSFPSDTPAGDVVTAEPGSGTFVDVPSPTLEFPSVTPTPFPTDTPTLTPTATASLTPTTTATFTPSATETPAVTATFTEFPTLTPSQQGVAVQITVNDQQATATAIILTFEASQGTFYPTVDPNAGGVQPTQDPNQPQVTQPPGPTAIPPGFFEDCDEYIDPGETLGNIAVTYNVAIEEIAAHNNITNPDFIRAGDTIKIPGCGRNPTAMPSFTPDPTQTLTYNNSAGPISYTVEPGDNIYRLSVKFGVTMSEILAANPAVTNINLIIAGDVLTIPTRSQVDAPPTATPTQGAVQESVPAFPTATIAG
ncbi:MAG: LysM peptidoglycan-binding domain-containing protein [Chloroflexi bacterium]|nr:LysM peptidoglycan-binding domain-containing protein [Chloroflexota bacterium]